MTIKCSSPCYELHRIPIEVTNPFPQGGDFRIMLVESKEDFLNVHGVGAPGASAPKAKKKKPKKVIVMRMFFPYSKHPFL